jgi:hypothetical protein
MLIATFYGRIGKPKKKESTYLKLLKQFAFQRLINMAKVYNSMEFLMLMKVDLKQHYLTTIEA